MDVRCLRPIFVDFFNFQSHFCRRRKAMLEHEETLFNQALEIQNARERADFLSQACGGNEELRQRIERLIRLLPKGEMLEPTLAGGVAASPANAVLQQVGDQIGPYKLIEKIGEGGMGSVYMAEQKTPVRRLVALKIVKPGMDSRQVLARFDAERQALALMEHPNIARIVDAGTTKLGHPFFAMELVRGIPLNEFCDQKRQTIRERLGIFLQVCQAIQHAHQKGIIHRDLKPNKVLVTMLDVIAVS